MITKEQAMSNATNFLKQRFPDSVLDVVIDRERIAETNDAWFIDYNSKKFLETKNPGYLILIRSPIRVDKVSGDCALQIEYLDASNNCGFIRILVAEMMHHL